MKSILSLNSYHYRRGGSDVVYLDHAELLESNGWENTFFSMHHPKNLNTPDDKYFIDLVDFEYAGSGLNKVKTALRSVYNNQARSKVKAMLQDKKFDIAHAHCVYHHLTPTVFEVLEKAGVPVVLTAHDLKVACPAYKMMNQNGVCEECKGGNYLNVIKNKCIKQSTLASAIITFEAYLYRSLSTYHKYVSHIVAPSKFYRDKIIEWGFDPNKVSYVPNFTKVISTKFKSDYRGNPLYFGRLSEEKGLFTLIDAAKKSSVTIDIIGSGPIEDELISYANSINAPVNFLGRLDGDTLWSKIGAARCIVIPSEWYENAPMSVLEAFQLERPIIGANIGGIPELVNPNQKHEECGWLFESGNSEQLSKLLTSVVATDDPVLREKGSVGRALALGRFSKDSYYRSIEEIYARLLKSS